MPARLSLVCWNLLILGACSGLLARCGAVDGRGEIVLQDIGLIDGTFAFQVRSTPTYASTLRFYMAGIDYTSLVTSTAAVNSLIAIVAGNVCGTISRPTVDCQVELFPEAAANTLSVEVTVAGSSLSNAEATTAEIDANVHTILPAVVLMAASDSLLTPHGIATGTSNVKTRTEHDFASATDDPHLTSVAGEKFDVNVPGSYVLVRAPADRRLPAKLELTATLRASAGAPCGLYIKSIELGGEWLGGRVVGVVPLQRNVEGDNGAGNSTLRTLSVRVGAQGGASRTTSGEYQQWGDLGTEGRSLSGRVRLAPVWRQLYADAGRPQEAQAFQFHVQGDGAGHNVTLEVAQAAHQALDIRVGGLRSLGFGQLGGLLGTEEHDQQLEQVADDCKAFRAKAMLLRTAISPERSSMTASWDALL